MVTKSLFEEHTSPKMEHSIRISDEHIPPPEPENLWSWKDVLLISVTSVLILISGSLLITALFKPFEADATVSPVVINVLFTSLEALAILLSIYLFAIRRRHLLWNAFGLKSVSIGWIVVAIALGLAILPAVGLIALLIQFLLGLPFSNPQLEFVLPGDLSFPGALIMLGLVGFVVPLAEELFFRGLLFRWLRQFLKPWPAILISSAIFGALHGELSIAGATFFIGIILAWLYEKSGSLWTSVTVHVINNAIKLFLLYALVALGIEIPIT